MIKKLGMFDKTIFKDLIEDSQNWGSYPYGSPAEGMKVKHLSDTSDIKYILSEYFDIERIKWGKLHKLRPRQEIKLHADPVDGAENCHVIHLVLQTNDKVIFNLNGKSIKCQEGSIYTFDNTLPHYVKNNGNSDRIHLMTIIYGKEK